MKTIAVSTFTLLAFATLAVGQVEKSEKIDAGNRVTLYSNVLNETRELYIYSPKIRSGKNLKVPVIYLFDAGSLFLPTLAAVKFLNSGSYLPQMPEAVIVGITNTDRSRDMPVPQEIDNTDGAKKFLQFLSKELVPYINKNFAANGLNILVGHSQGGLFVTYAAIQEPQLFPFIVALDAPMTVTKSVEEYYTKELFKKCGMKYISLESLYGWGDRVAATGDCINFTQTTIVGENHETMPYKGIYEGLKFLFNDYLPPVQDWPLKQVHRYYDSLAKKYHVPYSIPSSILLESAKQNIAQSNKLVAVELITEHDKYYGAAAVSKELLVKANAISKGPDERVAYHLSHAPPAESDIKPFFGKWSGLLVVPGGMNTTIDWEIASSPGGYQMIADIMKQFKSKSDFLYVNEKKELIWGRKHGGGGIYLSIGKLSDDGLTITGTEDLIGFDFPPGMPAFRQNSFEYKKLSR